MENQEKNDEVFIEETFNASIEAIFQAWVDPEKLLKWYAPNGCTIFFKKINVTTGGEFHSCITHPQFGSCWCIGTYIEVVPHSKIVFTMINADENGQAINPVDIGMDADWPGSTLVTVTIAEIAGKTKLQLRQTVSIETAKKTGAYPSWLQMIEKIHLLINEY